MPHVDRKLSWVEIRDVAKAAALTLAADGHDGESYVLTDLASIFISDAAAELSQALGKEVTYVNLLMEAARASMRDMGLDEWFAGASCEYLENFSNGGGDHTSDDFEELTGHPLRSYGTFARDFAPYFGGS